MRTQKPHAVICSAATGYGGSERNMEQLLPLLMADYRLFVLVENKRHYDECITLCKSAPGNRVARLPALPRPLQLAFAVCLLLWMCMRHRPTFYFANTNKSGLIVTLAAMLAPSIGRRARLYILDFQWRMMGFIMRRLPDALYVLPTPAMLEPSSYIKDRFTARHRWTVVPCVVNKPAPPVAPVSDQRAPTIVMLATIQRWKGQEYMVRALARLPSTTRLLLLGDVHQSAYLEYVLQLADELGVAARVEVRRFTTDVASIYGEADCVVVASVADWGGPESFSLVTVEAWRMERPVVAFSVGGPKFLIEDGVNGLLVPQKDWQALADAVGRILAESGLAKKLIAGGLATAQNHNAGRVYKAFRVAMDPGAT